MQVDVSALAPAPVTAAPAAADEGGGSSEGFVRTRSYNLSITYDKYYQVCVCALMNGVCCVRVLRKRAYLDV